MPKDQSGLRERFLAGDVRALAQAISWVEDQESDAAQLLAELGGSTGRSRVIGITGPPGAGKSTLTGEIARSLLDRGEKVGMLLIDPSSPFSGGAILGDRIRMGDLSGRDNLYIRSLGSRGSLGGLSAATAQAIELLDCFGHDTIIVETVGTGQAETDVVEAVDTVVVLAVPGLGDDIQAMKAGIMEIADVFVINKADREGAERTARQIRAALEMGRREGARPIPVLMTTATKRDGIVEVVAALDEHTAYLMESGELKLRRERRAVKELQSVLTRLFETDLRRAVGPELDRGVERIVRGEDSVYAAAVNVYNSFRDKGKEGDQC